MSIGKINWTVVFIGIIVLLALSFLYFIYWVIAVILNEYFGFFVLFLYIYVRL